MNVKLLLVVSLFVFQFGFSQTGKLLNGVVSSDNFLLYNVDVINKTSKQFTRTNQNGEFEIVAHENDSLFFYSKDFYLKIMLVSPNQIEKNSLEVILLKKPEELQEVVISKTQSLILSKDKKYEQSKLDQYATEKFDNTEGPQTMRNGTFVHGLNFVTIGKKLLELFSKDKETKKETVTEIDFVTLAKSTCDAQFFTKNLKLKPEEIDLFLQFCALDLKAKKLKENANVLSMMDFLYVKNAEFQRFKELDK